MTNLRICYEIGDVQKALDYIDGNVELVVERLAGDGLSTSTVSLVLRLLSTLEELSLHQEHGFAVHLIAYAPLRLIADETATQHGSLDVSKTQQI